MSVNKTLIIAHRGTHRDRGDENTLIAFQRAIAAGVDGLEVDVQLYGNR
ncbi:MAG: glycerophosphodiester phosphodiesterase family protein, partial [Weissella cibaria]